MTHTDQTKRPLVTFALFAYNQEAFVREAIEGAFSQTYEPLEIILSDDCSSDRTFEIMQEMATEYEGSHRVLVRKNIRNLGLASHINTLIDLASGDYFSWAAGDDIALPKKITCLMEPIEECPEIVGTHSSVKEIDLRGDLIGIREAADNQKNITIDKVLEECASVVSQSHLFKTSVFRDFGPFDCKLTNEGAPITYRELRFGRIFFIEDPLTLYRVGSGTSTYQGSDKQRLRITEPQKISGWRYSSYSQIVSDIENLGGPQQHLNKARKRQEFYNNLLKVNRREEILRPLLRNALLQPFGATTLRAALRVLLPQKIYSAIKSE